MGSVRIDEIARVKLSHLKALFQKARESEGSVCKARFALQGTAYEVCYCLGWGYLLFTYTDRRGQRKEVSVCLQMERSNLGRGSVMYFLCPYTGHKCRSLYLDGFSVASRYAFRHTYSYQSHSHRERLLDGFLSIGRGNPERKWGKPTYQGKVTRYGKRLLRYEAKAEKAYRGMQEYLKPTRRGRPSKAG